MSDKTTIPPRRKPGGDKSPNWLFQDRIAEACAVIASKPSIHRCELHKLFTARWKSLRGRPVCWRTVDSIVSRARQHLAERVGRPKDEWIKDIAAGYERDMGDKDSRIRNAARQGIRDMLGLDAPRRTELSGPHGGPVQTQEVRPLKDLSPERLRELAALVPSSRLLEMEPVSGNGHTN